MDTPEILFYLVAALIYFLSRKKKKPGKTPQKRRPSRQEQPGEVEQADSPAPELSFEDLLKELTGQRTTTTPEPKQPEPVPAPVPKEEPRAKRRAMGEEMELLRSSFDDEAIQKKYEESIGGSSGEKSTKSKKKKRFEAYIIEEDEGISSEIRDMLTSPDDVKKAIILKEVLDRRY